MPRKLRVLRIDDRAGEIVSRARYDPIAGDGVVRAPLELIVFPGGEYLWLGISGLRSAEDFWTSLDCQKLPDIVLGDVNFERDGSSPLKAWGNDLPTGLSHSKGIVAIARAAGAPIAIGLHTANPEWWASMLGRVDGTRVFALLAAHEIIELAAILRDPISRKGNDDLEPVWGWLRTRTASTPEALIPVVLTDYRRQIVQRLWGVEQHEQRDTLWVLPSELGELRGWCERMRKAPSPLEESDPGLPLLYPNGSVDRLSFASLFADVDDIRYRVLPSGVFDTPSCDAPPWELVNGLPQIGAIIATGSGLGDAAAEATRALERLPLGSQSLGENLRTCVSENVLARGLAVLFRIVEIAFSDECMWGRLWNAGPWSPATLNEADGPIGTAASVETWVELTEQALRVAENEEGDDGFADLAAIQEAMLTIIRSESGAESLQHVTTEAMRMQLGFLCDMQLAEREIDRGVGDDRYRIRRPPGHGLRPPRPQSGTKLHWLSESMMTELQHSLGFGAARGPATVDNPNAVPQIIHDAFVRATPTPTPNQKAIMGREYLEQVIGGSGPRWVVGVCRDYCRTVLQWGEERTWPTWLRGS